MTKEEYNNEPIHYCTSCLSIKIVELDDIKIGVCTECGNTHFKECHIDEWNKLYVKEYGGSFLGEDV